ncbi:ABC transporter permease [Roseomonas sp. SSH11]|uniref:ABC transporter permease n=1 Tax=Pararoseomonas baculiformis TaxID=2820812 RepID=A0ABS4AG56_9PROT|nr:ABC transporter permease [Pararoseomonas baculiformis]MBP0445856.1 ABC transporter permease [Pararoseomonas baculiformis]
MMRRGRIEWLLGGGLVVLFLAISIAPGLFAGSPDAVAVTRRLEAPSAEFWFGTDETGRDVYARVVHGAGSTLGVVATAIALAGVLGGSLGALAGFAGRLPDLALSRSADALLAFPPIILGVVLASTLGTGAGNLILALAIIYAPVFFRVARAAALMETGRAYVEAARTLGHGEWAVLTRHVARNVAPSVVLQCVILFPLALQIQAALGFLGLGVPPPSPDWGASLQESRNYLTVAPWLAIFPGLALLLAAMATSLLGRALQTAGR